MNKNFHAQRGFTLIELTVVIAIIGILASVVTASLVGARSQAHLAAAATSEHEMSVASGNTEPSGYFALTEGSGTTVSNGGSGLSDGTLSGTPTFSTDIPLNQRYSLAMGAADMLTASGPQMGLSSSTPGITMGGWFKLTGPLPSSANVVGGASMFSYGKFVLVLSSTGHVILNMARSNITSTATIDDGKWHYIAATVNSSNYTEALYIDGALQGGIKNYAFNNTYFQPAIFSVGVIPASSGIPAAVGNYSDPFIFNAPTI